MAREREPQSYGSGKDWVSGRTGETVNDQDAGPSPEHREFYDEKRESEESHSAQGGLTSDVQLAENAQVEGASQVGESAVPRVTDREGGAKRDSFFKRRDYE